MCPFIKESCCTVKDQVTFYDRWITNGEESKLKSRLEFYFLTYEEFLDKMQETYSKAQNLKIKLEKEEASNCKLIAEKISQFELSSVIPDIKKALKRQNEFFIKTYSGVYCSICDAESHKYFSVSQKKIFFSEKYC